MAIKLNNMLYRTDDIINYQFYIQYNFVKILRQNFIKCSQFWVREIIKRQIKKKKEEEK